MNWHRNPNFFVSLRCATRGLWHVLREERNARYHWRRPRW
jgi:diacylglycerol kinase